MNRVRPYFPSQTHTGETYVVDGRNGQIVAIEIGSFDTAQRWQLAKRKAEKLNDAHSHKVYVRRRILALAFALLSLAVGFTTLALLRV